MGGVVHIFQDATAVYLTLNLALNVTVLWKGRIPFSW